MRLTAGVFLSVLLLSSQPSVGADLTAGRAKAETVCQTCHGLDGVATAAMVPNLSGQQEEYLAIQLEAYRAGTRQHAQMSIVAQALTDADIENLARWYSNIKVTVEPPE
jgi:cytochrome c553